MKFNFNKSIFENKQKTNMPFLVAHRGVNGANVPCNTILAYKAAVDQGADVVEIDVTKSKDGEYFVFHPGMEPVFLKCGKFIPDMTADEVSKSPLLNLDEVKTHYRVPLLKDVLLFLKDKVYINVDKFWMDVKGISEIIRQCGVEKQVIVKTPTENEYFEQVEKYAPDMMFMPLTRHIDDVTEIFEKRNVRYIGVEALFDNLADEVASPEYIKKMHENGFLVWGNSIVYNEADVISAGLTDDISLEKGGEFGWGKLADLGFDFIQTDWLLAAKTYLQNRK